MNFKIKRTNSEEPDFSTLVKELDVYLKTVDGDDHEFYHQYNNIDVLNNVVVAYVDEIPVACGSIKKYNATTVEIKRMYVKPNSRGKGLAKRVLKELEIWAKELGCQKIILETGKKQVEAVAFYKKCAYHSIPNYGQYKDIENSLCFEKLV